MENSRITSSEFLLAFLKVWSEISKEGRNLSPYQSRPNWTTFFLKEGGVLERIVTELRNLTGKTLISKGQIYTIDFSIYSGENLLKKKGEYYSNCEAIIEHEMWNDLEEEMWKLSQWKSPLKIIFMYDWCTRSSEDKSHLGFAREKIRKLIEMVQAVNGQFEENPSTEYLFIVGQCDEFGKKDVKWYSLLHPGSSKTLTFNQLFPIESQ